MPTKGSALAAASLRKIHKGQQVAKKTNDRAEWMLREFELDGGRHSYAKKIAAVRKRFGCGETAAEQAYARAGEIQREQWAATTAPGGLERQVSHMERLATKAELAEDFVGAGSIRRMITQVTGVAAPTTFRIGVAATASPDKLAHVDVLHMTPAQRTNRLRELEARESSIEDAIDADSFEKPPSFDEQTVEPAGGSDAEDV